MRKDWPGIFLRRRGSAAVRAAAAWRWAWWPRRPCPGWAATASARAWRASTAPAGGVRATGAAAAAGAGATTTSAATSWRRRSRPPTTACCPSTTGRPCSWACVVPARAARLRKHRQIHTPFAFSLIENRIKKIYQIMINQDCYLLLLNLMIDSGIFIIWCVSACERYPGDPQDV